MTDFYTELAETSIKEDWFDSGWKLLIDSSVDPLRYYVIDSKGNEDELDMGNEIHRECVEETIEYNKWKEENN